MRLTNSVGLLWAPSAAAAVLAASSRAIAYPRLLRTIVANLIESWPAEVYSEGLVRSRILGRETFYVCDPALIRQLLVDHADSLAREDFMLRALSPVLGRGILTSDGAPWRAQRRTVAPVFRHDRIKGFAPVMAEAVAATRERWGGAPARLDIAEEMMRTTLDIIVAAMVSNEPGLDVGRFGRDLSEYLDRSSWKIALTMAGAPAWAPHPGVLRARAAARRLRADMARIIASRRDGGRHGRDLLGLMLEARDGDGGAPMSDVALVDNLLTFVAAGHETTALVMAWTFRLLAEHPQVTERVRAEIDASPAAEGAPPEAFPYARQVILEAMRLYPPAPLIVRRTAREVRLGETTIPAGRSVHVPVYAVHRHRGLWPSPETFDPSRFDAAAAQARDRHAYLPFGAGPRVCIGMSFALTECLTILTGLLGAFDIASGSERRPEARFKITLRPEGGMPMLVSPRRAA